VRRWVIALDVYGTVIDTAGIALQLGERFGARAPAVAQLWREKQLEFTFRRALMRQYADFDACTTQALRYVSTQLGISLDEAAERALLQALSAIAAFHRCRARPREADPSGSKTRRPDQRDGAVRARSAGARRHRRVLRAILSADRLRTFKPDPAVYALLKQVTDAYPTQACLVSGNPFDVIGAKACGLTTVWLRRDPERIFDPQEFAPDAVIPTLAALGDALPRLGFPA
jgi:2-haloacid dehalogenase